MEGRWIIETFVRKNINVLKKRSFAQTVTSLLKILACGICKFHLANLCRLISHLHIVKIHWSPVNTNAKDFHLFHFCTSRYVPPVLNLVCIFLYTYIVNIRYYGCCYITTITLIIPRAVLYLFIQCYLCIAIYGTFFLASLQTEVILHHVRVTSPRFTIMSEVIKVHYRMFFSVCMTQRNKWIVISRMLVRRFHPNCTHYGNQNNYVDANSHSWWLMVCAVIITQLTFSITKMSQL